MATAIHAHHGHNHHFSFNFKSIIKKPAAILLQWQRRAHLRCQLQELDDHMLKDIGLTRGDVIDETSKPFYLR